MSKLLAAEIALVAGLATLAVAVRAGGVQYGLPFSYYTDEPNVVARAADIARTGQLNPGWFAYPSLTFYVDALAYLLFRMAGGESLPLSQGSLPIDVGGWFYLWARWVDVLFGALTVPAVYLLARRLQSWRAGSLAAGLLAVEPTHAFISASATVDVPMTLFIVLSLWLTVGGLDSSGSRHWRLSAVAVGLAASAKYNGALAFLPLALAIGKRADWRPRPWLLAVLPLAGLAAVAFALTSPFTIVDWRATKWWILFELRHYSTGELGFDRVGAWQYYLQYLYNFGLGPLLFAASLMGLVYAAVRRERAGLLVLSFVVVWSLMIGTQKVYFDRTVMPVIPLVLVLMAVALDRVIAAVPLPRVPLKRGTLMAAIALLLGVLLAREPVERSLQSDWWLQQTDTRTEAHDWIVANLESGARVGVDSWGPYVPSGSFDVYHPWSLSERPLDDYRAQGFRYLVASSRFWLAYFAQPDKFPKEAAFYKELLGEHLLAEFQGDSDSRPGPTIRIYGISAKAGP